MIDIKKLEFLEGDDGRPFIRILDGEYAGVCVLIGGISFPDPDEPVMSYQYDIIEGSVSNTSEFEKHLGDALVDMILERLKNQKPILYKGGADET